MTTKQKVFFKNKTLKMAGEIHFSADFDPLKKYRAIVSTHPGNGVNEQVSGLHAQKWLKKDLWL